MRKRWLALAAALILTLAACGKRAAAPSVVPEGTPDTRTPLTLDTLNVEFAVGGRDAETLLALQRAFPSALTEALATREVSVRAVNVTFGASGEATETAIRLGTVQLAFLPAEDYLPYMEGEPVAAERTEELSAARGLLISGVTEDGFTDALIESLPMLAEVLAPYAAEAAGGVYEYDEDVLAAILDAGRQDLGL